MLARVLTIMSIIFLSQTIVSCILNPCGDDNGPSAYDVVYTESRIGVYDTSGFNEEIATDSVYKFAFGLQISVDTERTPISTNYEKGFAFNSLFACSPSEPEYNFDDPLDNVEIFFINTLTGEKKNAGAYFGLTSYNDNVILFKDKEHEVSYYGGYYSLTLEPTKLDSIPNSVIFRIEATLQSGTVLSDQSPTIILKE